MKRKLSDNLKKLNSVAEQLSRQIDKLITSTVLIEYDDFIIQSTLVMDSSFQLWDQTVNELDFLLQVRIDGFVRRWIGKRGFNDYGSNSIADFACLQ